MPTAKICGLSTAGTLDAAIKGGASHVGFVVFPPSPRHLPADRLGALAGRVAPDVRRVGVFVDPDEALLDSVARHLEVIQLHKVSAARAASVRARYRREVWATVAVKARADLDVARSFVGAADRILYDAKTPDGATLPGGMGLRFDWTLLDGFDHPLPWLLSGGLDADTVGEAVRQTRASLVDVSSGVESEPGVKDPGKIAAFLRAVGAA